MKGLPGMMFIVQCWGENCTDTAAQTQQMIKMDLREIGWEDVNWIYLVIIGTYGELL
jgi:hypothetical protein